MKSSRTYSGKYKPYGKGGWFEESYRHGLAARGIKTRTRMNYPNNFRLVEVPQFNSKGEAQRWCIENNASLLTANGTVQDKRVVPSYSYEFSPTLDSLPSRSVQTISGLPVKMVSVSAKMSPEGSSAGFPVYPYEEPRGEPIRQRFTRFVQRVEPKLKKAEHKVVEEGKQLLGTTVLGLKTLYGDDDEDRKVVITEEHIGESGEPYPVENVLAGLNAKGKLRKGGR